MICSPFLFVVNEGTNGYSPVDGNPAVLIWSMIFCGRSEATRYPLASRPSRRPPPLAAQLRLPPPLRQLRPRRPPLLLQPPQRLLHPLQPLLVRRIDHPL